MSSCFLKSTDGRRPDYQTLGLGWSWAIRVLSLPEKASALVCQCDSQNPQPPLEAMGPFLDFLERNLPFILFSLPQNKTSFFHLPLVQYLRSQPAQSGNLQPKTGPENQKKVVAF